MSQTTQTLYLVTNHNKLNHVFTHYKDAVQFLTNAKTFIQNDVDNFNQTHFEPGILHFEYDKQNHLTKITCTYYDPLGKESDKTCYEILTIPFN